MWKLGQIDGSLTFLSSLFQVLLLTDLEDAWVEEEGKPYASVDLIDISSVLKWQLMLFTLISFLTEMLIVY